MIEFKFNLKIKSDIYKWVLIKFIRIIPKLEVKYYKSRLNIKFNGK